MTADEDGPRQLGQLGGLEVPSPRVQPSPGAVDLAADTGDQDEDEQDERRAEEDRAGPEPELERDPRRRDEGDDPDERPRPLLLEEVAAVLEPRILLRRDAARRVEHDEAEAEKQKDDDREVNGIARQSQTLSLSGELSTRRTRIL